MTTRPLRKLLLCALLLGACDTCGSSKPVPCKRDVAAATADAGKARAVPVAAEPPSVATYADGPAQVEIGGGRITLPDHRIAASVQYDITGDSLRDVVPFPKTQRGQDLLMQSPSGVTQVQLEELALRVLQSKKS